MQRSLENSDYFLLIKKDEHTDKLVYFDKNGHALEKDVDPKIAAEAFRIFDGKPRCAVRSSGGMALVEPKQIVLAQGQNGPELKIRVEFRDLKIQADREEYIVHTKILSPRELMPAFEHDPRRTQRFVVETAKGLIPIFLFHVTDSHGFFVDADDFTRILKSKAGVKIDVQTYRIALDQIRLAHGTDIQQGRTIYDLAQLNLARLKRLGEKLFPRFLRNGSKVSIPASPRVEDIRRLLQAAFETPSDLSVISLELRRDITGELIPFGQLE